MKAHRLLGICVVFQLACTSSPPPESAAGAAASSETPEGSEAAAESTLAGGEGSEPTADEGEGESDPAPQETAAGAPAAPPAVSLEKLCEETCDAMAEKCTPAQIKKCKLSYCPKYATDQSVCDPVVREAFACARKHKDVLLCSNVVSDTCGKRFFAADECLATGKPPEKPVGESIPEGWARTDLNGTPFTVALPRGVKQKSSGSWEVSDGGISYEIESQPAPPAKKYDQKAFYKIASKLLGRCAPKMKLFALIEEPNYSLIHYKTQCPDKTQERGVLYVLGSKLYIARSRWQSGENPNAEAFAFSFQQK